MSFSAVSSCKIAAAAEDMGLTLFMSLAQSASGIMHSVRNLVFYCPGVKGLLLSCHNKSLGVCFDVAFFSH